VTAPSAAPVLVLEDSDEDFDTLVEAGRHTNLHREFQRATTGDECLARLQAKQAKCLGPGIIMLDLNTSGMDGRETLAVIRSDNELPGIPVVVLSTSANPRDVSYCYANGASAYHVKRVRYEQHLQLLRDILSYWRGHVVPPEAAESLA